MNHWRAIPAGVIGAALASGIGFAAPAKEPYEVIRSVEALHDQMVLGSVGAEKAMPGLLRQLAARLVEADPAVWSDPRNARAVVVYILSGGEIRVAHKVLQSGKCSPTEQRLIEGALDYLEGAKEEAKSLLEGVDPRTLEAEVGGHVALAQAALIADDKPKKAMAILDVARVLVPGTLVEDAALRREVFLAAELGDFDKFISMSEQYLRRFQHSVYAENFHRGLTAAVASLSRFGTQQQLASIAELLKQLNSHEQLRLYLHVAQTSLLDGKIEPAKWAADRAAQLAPQNGVDVHRALLYGGAAAILTTDYDHGIGALKALDAAGLPHDDALLKEAALGLATQIRQWPEPPVPADKKPPLPGAAPPPPPPPPESSTPLPTPLATTVESSDAALAQAQQMLTESDALLEGQTQ
jgi:chemotaxis protein MotC